MGELAGSLYVVSTAAFASIAAVVGIRLLLLSAETGQMAERLLGFGLLLTASLGYGVMMVAAIGRSMMADPSAAPAIYTWISTAGWSFHNIGVMCLIGFVVHVFRHGSVWARTLAATMSITLWAGWALYVSQGGMADGVPRGGYWITLVVVGTYPLWTAAESFAYYARMRRRVALGLGDRLVANRFLLWGLDPATTTPAQMRVVVQRVLPRELETRGVSDAEAICKAIFESLGAIQDAVVGESPEAVFERLGG